MTYIDKDGYRRNSIEHSNLIHRNIAYHQIYLRNRDKYPLPFSKYQVHHKDKNKLNNEVSNLQLVTKEEHEEIHGLKTRTQDYKDIIFGCIIVVLIFIFLWFFLSK